MELNKLIKDEKVSIEETFLKGSKPYCVSENINGDGAIKYYSLRENRRCLIRSGSSAGDETELNFNGLNFGFRNNADCYPFIIVTFHGVIVTPSQLTEGSGANVDLAESWNIGLKSGSDYVLSLKPYYKRTSDRARIVYKNLNGGYTDAGNVIVYANQHTDISFPLLINDFTPRFWTNGVNNRLIMDDIPNDFGLQDMDLYPYIKVKNIDGVSSVMFNGVSITAYKKYNGNIIYN